MDTNTTPNNSPAEQAPVAPTSTPVAHEHRKVGPIVAILVIIIVLVAAAIYLFASRTNKEPATDMANQATQGQTQDQQASASVTPVTNSSDDVGSIEADLNASVNGLDEQNF